jgi:hypothetical protein
MIRFALSLAACLLVLPAVAAPPGPQRVSPPQLPLPPMPPAVPPANEAAPIPSDGHLRASAPSDDIRVGLQVFRATLPDTGAGFSPGSRYQMYEERRPVQTPGIRITVPLQ